MAWSPDTIFPGMPTDLLRLPDSRLLRLAIKHSGLSDRQFARRVLLRSERTVRRYLADDSKMSGQVRDVLVEYVLTRRADRRAVRGARSLPHKVSPKGTPHDRHA